MSDVVDRTRISEPVREALRVLAECVQVSTACASTMIELGGMAAETRTALDCADVCAGAHRVLARHGGLDEGSPVTETLEAAIAAASASAQACGAHAEHHDHCAEHSRVAAACAQTVRALVRR